MKTKKKARPIIATRKSCNANGTGLSHYVMMDVKK
jgi:modified peptide precursor CbpA